MTSTEARQAFAAWQHKKGLADNTVTKRDWLLGHWQRHLSPRSFFEATADDVDAFCPADPATTRRWYLSNLSCFYQWAIKKGITLIDPTMPIDRPRMPRRKPRNASPSDYATGYEAADQRMRTMLALAGLAGLRCCEIAKVHRGDLDFHAGEIRVVGKGEHEREVPMADALAETLEEWLPRTNGFLFHGRGPTLPHVRPSTVSTMVGKHFDRIGLGHVTAHMLRHMYGTELSRRGVPIEVIQEWMGHANIATTRGYIKVGGEALAKARALAF